MTPIFRVHQGLSRASQSRRESFWHIVNGGELLCNQPNDGERGSTALPSQITWNGLPRARRHTTNVNVRFAFPGSVPSPTVTRGENQMQYRLIMLTLICSFTTMHAVAAETDYSDAVKKIKAAAEHEVRGTFSSGDRAGCGPTYQL